MDRAARRHPRAHLTALARFHAVAIVGGGLVIGGTVTGLVAGKTQGEPNTSPPPKASTAPASIPDPRASAARPPGPATSDAPRAPVKTRATRRPAVVPPAPARTAAPDASSNAS